MNLNDKNILMTDTVALGEDGRSIVIIDQTKLPGEAVLLTLRERRDIFTAIKTLQVRGAPAIGVTAAFALYLAAAEIADSGRYETCCEGFLGELAEARDYYASSRPTAVNLFWALGKIYDLAASYAGRELVATVKALRAEAAAIRDGDVASSRAIGEYGLTLLRDGDGILTHCNAGQLATVRYGTALAPIHVGREKGMNFRVYCDETRPLLQGARLSASELVANGVDTTVICDNMASQVMKNGWIQVVITGADRIAANGDSCNKIGTSGVAILAKHYGIPFYIAAPLSTIDRATPNGDGIVIEQRKPDEVSHMWYKQPMTPEGAKIFNPAFDVTPAELITAIITEKGIIYPPFAEGISAAFGA
ncbi:MAG: S-methyl-5-thioribose-1-phosphate isomerase [Clostridiales bacterium]|nr:S-methyl-5-thioribose-1-phosphate isomerase [Clostridiales bacterium]